MAVSRDEEVGDVKGEEERAAPARSKKLLGFGILAGLLAAALGVAFFVWKGLPDISQPEAEAVPVEIVTAVSMDPFVVNLLDTEGIRYLKIKLDLDVCGIDKETLDKHNPKIRDSLIVLLSSKRYDEIASIEGKLRLREEIEYRLTQILGKQSVRQVYFTDFVVQ